MLIGTDCSLRECLDSGYLIMWYDARKIKDSTTPVPPDYVFTFYNAASTEFRYYDTQNNPPNPTRAQVEERSHSAHECSLEELIERYQEHKKGMDKCSGTEHPTNPTEYTNLYQVLTLADDINHYCGLE